MLFYIMFNSFFFQKSHTNLKQKVFRHSRDIDRLLHVTSTDISSASASELPSPSTHSFAFPRGSLRSNETSPVTSQSPSGRKEAIPVSFIVLFFKLIKVYFQEYLQGVDKLKLANAKLQSDAATAALKLMDAIFITEEMVNSNPSGVTKSKDPVRQRTIKQLNPDKMKYINGKYSFFIVGFV